MVICRYCGAPRKPHDAHSARCPVVRICFDPHYWPFIESGSARNAEKRRGRATGRSGDGRGWRKRFKRKAKR